MKEERKIKIGRWRQRERRVANERKKRENIHIIKISFVDGNTD